MWVGVAEDRWGTARVLAEEPASGQGAATESVELCRDLGDLQSSTRCVAGGAGGAGGSGGTETVRAEGACGAAPGCRWNRWNRWN
jgi:hypothetical protein